MNPQLLTGRLWKSFGNTEMISVPEDRFLSAAPTVLYWLQECRFNLVRTRQRIDSLGQADPAHTAECLTILDSVDFETIMPKIKSLIRWYSAIVLLLDCALLAVVGWVLLTHYSENFWLQVVAWVVMLLQGCRILGSIYTIAYGHRISAMAHFRRLRSRGRT